MNIYIAASSHEIERAQSAMRRVRESGHVITQDWTQSVLDAGMPDEQLHRDVLVRAARECLDGVYRANLFWLLLPDGTSTGAWTELGYALALQRASNGQRPRIVVSGNRRRSCFWTLADNVYETDLQALREVERYGRKFDLETAI